MTKRTKRSDALKAAQAAYETAQRAAGAHVKLTVSLKAEPDVKALQALRARFGDLTDGAIVRLALRELAAKKNGG